MSAGLHALMEQAARVRVYDGQHRSVRTEGVVIGYCPAPMLIIRRDDGTLAHESSELPRDVMPIEKSERPTGVVSGPPTRWGRGQVIAHLITGRVGEVQGVDFEESLVTVEWRSSDSEPRTGVARMENVREVTP